MTFKGIVHKYGDNVNTDVIIPARYCHTIDPAELASHCLADLDASFVEKVKPGDILAAGYNFGCGSSREVAPIAIKYSGISCVVARTFARIFFRNAVNIGLPIIECPAFVDDIFPGDRVEVEFEAGILWNRTRRKRYPFSPGDSVIREIIEKGGLVQYVRQKIGGGIDQDPG